MKRFKNILVGVDLSAGDCFVGVVHEVSCTIDALVRDEVDVWLSWIVVLHDIYMIGKEHRAKVAACVSFGLEQMRHVSLHV